MADILDGLSSLTLNIQEATQDSDLIKVNPYLNPELTKIHAVQTGVIMDKYIPILGQLEDIGKPDPGNCGVNLYTDNFPVKQKTWVPKLYSQRIPICVDDIPAYLKFWTNEQIASGRWENIHNGLKQYVLDLTALAVSRGIIRIAEFADTAADVIANGGYLTAGTDKDLFDNQDGMWKQIYDDVTLGNNLIPKVTITENTAPALAAQLALADDAAYQIFTEMIQKVAPEAMSGNLVFQVTRTLWNNWTKYVQGKGGAFDTGLYTNGVTGTTFGGFQVIVRDDWDRLIRKYNNAQVTLLYPHRAILADINNIPVGTSDTQSFSALDSFYDKLSKKLYIDVAWRQDMKILLEENIVVAY